MYRSMYRSMRSMFLWGAITVAAVASIAQTEPSSREPTRGLLEMAFTYNATLANQAGGSSFWMQGGSAQLHGQIHGGFGVVADVAGAHTANMNSSGVGLDLVTATFGPRYTWRPAHRGFALYGHALVGEAFGFNSVFPATFAATQTNSALALKLGGGVSFAFGSHHIAWRAVEADWLRTALPNSINNAQNSTVLASGIIFRIP
jgi:hypothetical protein